MKLGIVNQWYPPETGGGGVATYNVSLAHELTALGHTVLIIAATHQSQPRLEYDGDICVYRIPRPRISTRWDRRLPILGRYMRFLRTALYARNVRNSLPEIVVRHKLDFLEYADIEAEAFFHDNQALPPYSIRLHGSLFSIERYYQGKERPYSTTFIKAMEKKAVVNAVVLTSPTRAFAELVSSEYGIPISQIQVLPNFFSVDSCNWIKQHNCTDKPTILFVGRLEYLKGADILADAIPLVVERFPSARFIYLAHDRPLPDGISMKAALEQKFRAAGVLKHVQFVTASEFNGCFYAALQPDICVVPSRFETFSFPCLESMAHGMPVIASQAGGIPEVVHDGVSGILFPVGNVNAFAEAMGRLIGNLGLREQFGQAGRERVTRHFQPRAIAEKIAAIYETTSN